MARKARKSNTYVVVGLAVVVAVIVVLIATYLPGGKTGKFYGTAIVVNWDGENSDVDDYDFDGRSIEGAGSDLWFRKCDTNNKKHKLYTRNDAQLATGKSAATDCMTTSGYKTYESPGGLKTEGTFDIDYGTTTYFCVKTTNDLYVLVEYNADNDCTATFNWVQAGICSDQDTDGFGVAGSRLAHCASSATEYDCDDTNAARNPGKTEFCNGIDDNCNNIIDENCDKDQDGYIDVGPICSGTPLCANAAGERIFPCYGCGQIDCDFGADAESHPGARERCNGLDDDCDSQIDKGCDDDNDNYCDASMEYLPNPSLPNYPNCDPQNAQQLYCCYAETTTDGLPVLDCNDDDSKINFVAREVCDGIDNNCDGRIDESLDADADGWKPCGAAPDCNDNNPAISPAATEICDGVDNNCYAGVDEGCDSDQDGYVDSKMECTGTPVCANNDATATTQCHGCAQRDCDDINEDKQIESPEICDGKDSNCNDLADEGCDSDQDGYFDRVMGARGFTQDALCNDDIGQSHVAACNKYPTHNFDCDDIHQDAHPGGTEVCNGIDDDCDGLLDEGCDDDDDDYCDSSIERYPSWSYKCENNKNCCPLGGGDCNDNSNTIKPGAPDACDGVDNDCNPNNEGSGACTSGQICYTNTNPPSCSAPRKPDLTLNPTSVIVSNSYSFTPTTIKIPLALSGSDIPDPNQYETDTTTYQVSVETTDMGGSVRLDAEVFDGQKVGETKEALTHWAPHERVSLYAPRAGDYNIKITLDSAGEIDENDVTNSKNGELNNIYNIPWHVAPGHQPDLTIMGVGGSAFSSTAKAGPNYLQAQVFPSIIYDDAILSGTPYVVKLTMRPADNPSASPIYSAQTTAFAVVGYSPPGHDKPNTNSEPSVAFNNVKFARGGDYVAKIELDPDSKIPENDEGNNILEVPITIQPSDCLDKDNDGYGSSDFDIVNCPKSIIADCDDNNPNTPPTFYADQDGDGYGDSNSPLAACTKPDGYVTNSQDCDDSSADIKPGAIDACDDVDNNCNDIIDDGSAGLYVTPFEGGACTAITECGVDRADCTQFAGVGVEATACVPKFTNNKYSNQCQIQCQSGYTQCGTSCYQPTNGQCTSGQWACNSGFRLNENTNACEEFCTPQATRECYTGIADTDGVGVCRKGNQTCSIQGTWGSCSNQVLPTGEVCDGEDDDCDGLLDDGADGRLGSVCINNDDCGTAHINCVALYETDASKNIDTIACIASQCKLLACGIGFEDANNNLADGCEKVLPKGCTDFDRDNYKVPFGDETQCGPLDCDDRNGKLNPGRTEACNSIDDNCDGKTDQDAYGAPVFETKSCGVGICAGGTQTRECSDGGFGEWGACEGASVQPTTELCNKLDDNCDGFVDEPFDADKDGIPANVTACTQAYAGTPLDCNDNSAGVRPGAAEVCNGADDNCDGIADNIDGSINPSETGCACSGQSAAKIVQTKKHREEQNKIDDNCDGKLDSKELDRDLDGFAVYEKDCNDKDDQINPEARELCSDKKDNNCDGVVNEGCDKKALSVFDQALAPPVENITEAPLAPEAPAEEPLTGLEPTEPIGGREAEEPSIVSDATGAEFAEPERGTNFTLIAAIIAVLMIAGSVGFLFWRKQQTTALSSDAESFNVAEPTTEAPPREVKQNMSDFISSSVSQGYSATNIKQTLKEKGWSEEDVASAMEETAKSIEHLNKAAVEKGLSPDKEAGLKSYISEMKRKGFSKEQVKAALINGGWEKEAVEKYM